jgi:dTDP-4-amino-4,6-dideoxygalactose transaminase
MIPFLDLGAQYRSIKPEADSAVLRVMESTRFILGSEVATFEKTFAAYCDAEFAVAVNSGTSALHLALLASGIGPGDEVITVSMTFAATVASILYAGAVPVLVDVDPERWTMDPDTVERAITPRTKAIMPVHLHGRMADMPALMDIARRHRLILIEDAAQAHGAESYGRRAGSIGHIGCFSFYPGKNLGAYGEGGAVVTNDARAAETMRSLRDWGQEGKYNHVLRGFNYRMDEIQAAVLNAKMAHIERWTEARRSHAARYDALLAPLGIGTPSPDRHGRHVYHVYAVRVRDRDAVQAQLKTEGIGTGIHYPVPVHCQPAYSDLGYGPGDLPVSERLAAEFLSLPMYAELTPMQVETVAAAVARQTGREPRVTVAGWQAEVTGEMGERALEAPALGESA